jgi:hypothetical protein
MGRKHNVLCSGGRPYWGAVLLCIAAYHSIFFNGVPINLCFLLKKIIIILDSKQTCLLL